MKSFPHYGHRYILCSYDSIEVPDGVELAEPRRIIKLRAWGGTS